MQCGRDVCNHFAGIANALKHNHKVVFARAVASMAPRVARLLKCSAPRGVGKARGLIDVELRYATRGRGGRRGRVARRGRVLGIGAGVLAVLACGLELRLSILKVGLCLIELVLRFCEFVLGRFKLLLELLDLLRILRMGQTI